MKTDDLITMLARGPGLDGRDRCGARPGPVAAGWLPLAAGALGSAALMLALLGVRDDLGAAATLPAFWVKLLFAATLAVAGLLATLRLAVPGARLGWRPLLVALPVLLLWCLAAGALLPAPPAQRSALLWGNTWMQCPGLITLLSLPLLAGLLRLLRGWAPTRLRLAGAAAGLAAGAGAATLYCLHCREMSSVFVGIWYLLGMLIPAALGALLGPRVLRW